MNTQSQLHKQHGAVSLLTALVLLICITLIALLTAKTVLVETQVTADNYRTGQATEAASAAMERGVAYFLAGDLDHDDNTVIDYTGPSTEPTPADCEIPDDSTAFNFTLPETVVAGTQTTYGQFYFNNTDDNACDCQTTAAEDEDGDGDGDCMGTLGTNMNRGMIVAKGWSDDCTAVRTITQCVTDFNVFDNGEGPQQPFVSSTGVGVFGNAKIINRYNNSSIWAGGADAVHGASYGTYLRPSGTEIADYTKAQLESADENSNTQKVSDRNSGNGIDVITDDNTLAAKTRSTTNLTDPAQNTFFDMFFAHTKAETKNAAQSLGQLLSGSDSPVGKSNLIWFEGDLALHNGDVVGTANKPAVLIVNGDLDLTGGPFYGVIYVTGELNITGNPVVYGSVISENGPNNGAGTLTLVYKPWGDGGSNQAPNMFPGGAVVAGSWKDW